MQIYKYVSTGIGNYMRTTKAHMRDMQESIKTNNYIQYSELITLTDKILYDKILRNLCNINTVCEKYKWEFSDILFSDDLIENMKSYVSFGSAISLDKFKSVFVDAETKYKQYCKCKTKTMREILNNNPTLADTGSIVFFERKYKDPEIALEKYNEYHKNKPTLARLSYWTERGFTDEQAKEKVTERQSTFSLEKCIKKYGEVEGKKRWDERQCKWRESLGNRGYSEIVLSNFKRGGNSFPQNAAHFLGILIENYTDELFIKSIHGKDQYFETIFEKFTKEFSDYSRITRQLTEQNYTKYRNLIDPNQIRSSIFHLDHKYSVFSGFANTVPPEIIAHPYNLEMLSADENLSKHAKCSITLEELNEGILNFS